mgnify:FL=1
MITAAYTPDGIVLATLSIDTYYEMTQIGNMDSLSPIHVKGHQHYKVFWNKYAIVFRHMSSYSYDTILLNKFCTYEIEHQESIPDVVSFVNDIQSIINDTKSDIVSILAGYNDTEPYVYYIQGKDLRRINVTDKNEIIYNCQYVERNEVIGRVFRDIKLRNGDKWEERDGLRTRCDLYSTEKAIDLCTFMLHTNFYANNINITTYDMQLPYEVVVIQNNKVEIL